MKYGIRVLAIMAVLLAGMLGLAGCGDDDAPAATTSSSVASGGTSSTATSGGVSSSAVSGGTSSATSVPAIFTEDMSLPQLVRDYYRSAYGKSGAELKTALQTIITTGHTVKTYNDLWTLYTTADVAPNGRVWDMYTSTNAMGLGSVFIFGTDQDTGSGGTTELDVYNREHTWPQNTFGEWATARHDGHHVTPTDKLVNNKRSSYAYGEVSTATWTSQNGSKLGSARSGLGFTGTVFEPITIYKGDHARMHFYMAVRYAGSSYFTSCDWANPGADLKDWYKTMLINWHAIDPLHSKEVNRNNAIYGWQGNRNPFIDYPVLVSMLFGTSSGGTSSSAASSTGATSSAAASSSTAASSSAAASSSSAASLAPKTLPYTITVTTETTAEVVTLFANDGWTSDAAFVGYGGGTNPANALEVVKLKYVCTPEFVPGMTSISVKIRAGSTSGPYLLDVSGSADGTAWGTVYQLSTPGGQVYSTHTITSTEMADIGTYKYIKFYNGSASRIGIASFSAN